MAEGWSRVRRRAPGAGEASLPEDAGTDAGMVPSRRRSLRRELKALLEDQARAACDCGRQGRRESAEVPKESSQVIDNDGEDSLDPGFFGREMGTLAKAYTSIEFGTGVPVTEGLHSTRKEANDLVAHTVLNKQEKDELRNMLERFQGDWKKVLRRKRKQFVTETNAALRAINQKLGNAMRKQQEQRLKFYLKYYKQFLTLFGEWNRDVQKTKKEEEKLIILFHKQRDLFQKARTVQSQRLREIKNLHGQFLKDVRSFEENQNYLATNEGKEFRQEMAKLRRKIVADVQRQELENIRKSVQCLLL